MRIDVGGLGGEHLIPQFAGIARALVLAGEHADEILQPHRLEPLHRLHHHVVALAAEHAADHEDHLVVAADAPGAPHRLDPLARHRGRIEPLDIDARRHHRDAVPRRAVAVVDQLGDLIAHRDHAVAARHHAVVEPLEAFCSRKPLYQVVRNGTPVTARRAEGAPGRRAAMRMDEVAAVLADQAHQRKARCAASTAGFWLAMSSEHEFAAGRCDLGCQRPPRETTIGLWPAAARMRTSSTAPASAAPACSVGTTIRTVSGSVARSMSSDSRVRRCLRRRCACVERCDAAINVARLDAIQRAAALVASGCAEPASIGFAGRRNRSAVRLQQRGIDLERRGGDAARREHVFGELPRARRERAVGDGIERQRASRSRARARSDRRAAPPSRCADPPACAAAPACFRQGADRRSDDRPRHRLRFGDDAGRRSAARRTAPRRGRRRHRPPACRRQ